MRGEPLCEGHVEIRDDDDTVIGYEHGPDCLLERLDHAISEHPVLQRAIDFHWMSQQPGFAFNPLDLDMEEYDAVKILSAESRRYENEQLKQQQNGR